MAKQGKALPARRLQERNEDSAFLRSAEALGRIIGTLQRQLDGATKRLGAANHTPVLQAGTRNHRNGHLPAGATKPGARRKKGNKPVGAKADTRSASARTSSKTRARSGASRAKKAKSTAQAKSRRS